MKKYQARAEDLATAHKIIDAVERLYDVTYGELSSHLKRQPIADARWVAVYLIRKHTNLSTPQIGRLFLKDHSTVVLICQKMKANDGRGGVLAVEREAGLAN